MLRFRSPIWLAVLPLATGTMLQMLLPSSSWWWTMTVCALMLLLLPWRYSRKKGMTPSFTLQMLLTFTALGYGLAQVRMPGQEEDYFGRQLSCEEDDFGRQFTSQEKQMVLHVRVVDLPQKGPTTLKITTEVQEMEDEDGGFRKVSGKLLLMVKDSEKSSDLQPGDHLLLCCRPRLPSGSTNPGQFSYRRYLMCRGILYQAFVSDSSYMVLSHDARGWRVRVARWRGVMLERLRQSGLPAAQQGVAEALLLGWKGDVDEETQTQFRDAGITHLLCVSGLHVGIVAWLLGWCFTLFCGSRRGYLWKGVTQLVGIWVFVILTGMAPSTCRAGIMFSCIIVGELFFSKPPVLNSIAVSALILLLARPLVLLDVGFQLSYAAVIGIVTLCPPLQRIFQEPRFQDSMSLWLFAKVWDLLCVTTVAQLSTLPLVLYYFHQFPLYFVIANITVVPFATVLLATALVMLLLCWWPFAFNAIGWLLSQELKGVAGITGWVSSLPHAMLQNIYFDLPMAVMLGVAVLSLILFTQARNRNALLPLLSLTMLAMLSCHAAAKSVAFGRQHLLVCYEAGCHTVLEMIQGHSSMFFCDSATFRQPASVDYQVHNSEVCHQVHLREVAPLPRYLSVGTNRVAIVSRSTSYDLLCMARYQEDLPPRLRVHYVVLADYAYVSVSDLLRLYDFDTLVLASSLSWRCRNARTEECRQLDIPYYDVSQEGALIMEAKTGFLSSTPASMSNVGIFASSH